MRKITRIQGIKNKNCLNFYPKNSASDIAIEVIKIVLGVVFGNNKF